MLSAPLLEAAEAPGALASECAKPFASGARLPVRKPTPLKECCSLDEDPAQVQRAYMAGIYMHKQRQRQNVDQGTLAKDVPGGLRIRLG